MSTMETKPAQLNSVKAIFRRPVFIAAALTIALIIIFIVVLLAPHPSAKAYCGIYNQENAKITNQTTPKEMSAIYGKLEHVAPSEVKNDTTTLRKIYQKIDSDPSQSFTASLSGLSAETNIKDWVDRNCSK
jgi:lipopolysaccharide export LptBFGC system permease protein LptF